MFIIGTLNHEIMRINVIGTSGSGKSTFSKRIAQKLNIPYIELDALFWKPNWTESTNEEFFPKVAKAISGENWVLDGNYSRTQPMKTTRTQMVIYLDMPFHVVLYRIVSRSLIRGFKRQELWSGNKETVWKHLFTRDSMIWWVIKTFHKNRKRYISLFGCAEYSHIKFVRLRSPKEVEYFISQL